MRGVFWVFAASYIVLMPWSSFPADWLIKATPALSLAVLVLLRLEGRQRWLLVAALTLSAGGDIALSVRGDGAQPYFVVGLGLFLVAHLCYVAAFALHRQYQRARLPVMVGFGVMALVMAIVLIPHLGSLLLPVLCYIVAITAMGFAATLNTQGGLLLIVGAALFFLSDATIAVNTFLLEAPHPAAPFIIMPTYYAAQYCIAMALLRRN